PYICNNSMSSNLDGFKIALPKASGVGKFGESLSEIVVVPPRVGMTETFISFGNFPNPVEAENLAKYIKTKFARAMLGVLKITQDNTVAKYAQVPLQDFSDDSDIDWSQSISGIGKQLYQKYDLALDEIEFIESHVKEMD
ncbi:hypothetical protein, partial [Bifidobacterium sp. UTCIF-24]|uniref:hypothetical protein n=1 Tax=Bifidobacterium sp. UTCIF-24 TaxID=1465256 RepID=UPI001C613C7E